MPIYQTVGILIASFAAILGIPKLLAELTAAARLEKRLEVVLRLGDKVPAGDARDRIVEQSIQLGRRLAATYVIRPVRRDYLGVVAGILTPIVVIVAAQQVEKRLPQTRDYLVTIISNVILVLSYVVIVHGYVRVRTLTRNRKLYIALGCPPDPPMLSIPPFYAALPGRVTVDAVLEAAAKVSKSDTEKGLTEHAREAIADLERRYYRTKRPR